MVQGSWVLGGYPRVALVGADWFPVRRLGMAHVHGTMSPAEMLNSRLSFCKCLAEMLLLSRGREMCLMPLEALQGLMHCTNGNVCSMIKHCVLIGCQVIYTCVSK